MSANAAEIIEVTTKSDAKLKKQGRSRKPGAGIGRRTGL